MIENKRFIIIDYSTHVFDKITKEEYVCINKKEAYNVCNRLNEIWEYTQQLENHNIELVERSMKYEDKIDELKNKNKEVTKKIIKILKELSDD